MLTFRDQFNEIKSINNIYENFVYLNINKYISIYDNNFYFLDILKNNIEKNEQNETKLDYNIIYFKSVKDTFEYLYNNNKIWNNLVFNNYNRLNYKFEDKIDHNEKYLYQLIDKEQQKNLTISKLMGNHMEYLINYNIFCKIKNTGISLFNQFINIEYDNIKFYIVKEKMDYGIDSLIIYYKNNNPVFSIPIQIKYRTPYLNNLNIKECTEKMDILIRNNTDIINNINYDGNLKNILFCIIINNDKNVINDKQSEIWLSEKNGIISTHSLIFDKKDLQIKFFDGYFNKKIIFQFIEFIEELNNFCNINN